MVKYSCKLCNYFTSNKSDHKKHCLTKKHQKNVSKADQSNKIGQKTQKLARDGLVKGSRFAHENEMSSDDESEITIDDYVEKQTSKRFQCDYCSYSSNRSNNFNRHYNKCPNRLDKAKKIEKEMKSNKIIGELKIKLKSTETELKYAMKRNEELERDLAYFRKLVMGIGDLAFKSVSGIAYAIKNYNNAPPIEDITFSDMKELMDKSDMTLIDEIFYYYNRGKIGKYIGDVIVKLYTCDDPSKQSVWNTDSNRLTYLLRKIIDDDENQQWVVDKKGVDTTKYLITPLVDKIRDLAIEYQSSYSDYEDDRDKIMLVNDIYVRLMADIDSTKVHKEILKYISPYFHISKKTKKIKDKRRKVKRVKDN